MEQVKIKKTSAGLTTLAEALIDSQYRFLTIKVKEQQVSLSKIEIGNLILITQSNRGFDSR